jgi:hypothetical protein
MKKAIALFILTLVALCSTPFDARAYRDLETGQFITRDPAGFVDGPNLYTYVRENPWTHFDPEGLVSDNYKKRLNEADQQGRQIEAQRQGAMNKANSDVNAARAAYGKGEMTNEQLSSVESSARSQLLKTNQELRQQWESHWSNFFNAEKANGELNSGQYGVAMMGIGAQANEKFGPQFPGIAKIQEGGRIGGTAGAAAALGMMMPMPGGGKQMSHPDAVADFKANPGDWVRVFTQAGQTTRRGQQGGVNLESMWRNKKTGQELSTHEAFGPSGKSIHPENPSPNLPGGGAIRPPEKSKIEP